MITRCKFVCDEIGQNTNGHSAKFYAVHSGSEENKKFFKFTPSARLELQTTNEQVFVPGKEYYIDISEAVAEPAPIPGA